MLNEKTQSPKPPHHIGDPWQPNTVFFGRTQDMETIAEQLRTNKVVLLLNGIGGMGKTTLANELRFHIGDQYEYLIWTDLQSTPDTDEQPLRNHLLYNSIQLHQGLGIADVLRSEQDETQKWALFVRAITSVGKNILWVIDNARQQDQSTIDELPDNCYILLTSREKIGDIPTHYVDELNPNDALDLFKHYYKRPDDDDVIQDVCKAVGYHALSVELLAKTLNELPNKGASFLLQEFKKRGIGKQTTQAASTDIAAQQAHINRIFEAILQIGNIHHNIPALSALRTFMYLPCQDIFFQLIALSTQKHDPKQQVSLQNSLNELARLGWLRRTSLTEEGKTIKFWQIHPAVQEWLWQKQYKTPKQEEYIFDTIIEVAQKSCKEDPILAQTWIPYLNTLLKYYTHKNMELLKVYNTLAYLNEAVGQHAKALEQRQKGLAWAATAAPASRRDLAMSYMDTGVSYGQLGQYDTAISYYKRSCAIWEKNPLNNRHDLGGAYLNMALAYDNLSNYDTAIDYFERCRSLWEKTLPAKDPDLAIVYLSTGKAYYHRKQYDTALAYYERCQDIWQQILPEQHSDWADLYMNMANLYNDTGQYDIALDYYERCIAIRQQRLLPEHSSLAHVYLNMGNIYVKKGQYRTALTHYERCCAIYEQNPSDSNGHLAVLYMNIGIAYSNLNQFLTALGFYEQSAAILEQSQPARDRDLAILHMNMAANYSGLKEYAKALQYYERCQTVWEETLPPLHLNLATLYFNMGGCYTNCSQFEQALDYFRKSVAIYQQTLPENDSQRIIAEKQQKSLEAIQSSSITKAIARFANWIGR